jgi:hypothetical protein
MSKTHSRLPPPPIRDKQTNSSKRDHKFMTNEKIPPNLYTNPELKTSIKAPAFT